MRSTLLVKKKTIRKNRYKKPPRFTREKILGSLKIGFKLLLLMSAILGFSALFVAGYAAVTRSDYFKTESIKIRGLSRLTEKGVLKQAKIEAGDNLLAVNLSLVRKRLLAHPWICAVQVSRDIPETISIDITEHQALAVLDLGRKFMINTKGKIFKELEANDPQKLPLVTGIDYADISLGQDPLTRVMAAVVQVLLLSQSDTSVVPYKQIHQVYMDREMGVTLIAWPEERRIKLGFDQFEAKYKRIKKLLPNLVQSSQWQGFTTIDAINPDRIIVQLGASFQKGA